MPSRGKKYGNASQVKCHVDSYADGGMVKPKKGGKPKRITTSGKPGDSGPGGAHPGRNRPKKKVKGYDDGGKVAKKGDKKKGEKKEKPGLIGAAKDVAAPPLTRQQQIDKALKDAGA